MSKLTVLASIIVITVLLVFPFNVRTVQSQIQCELAPGACNCVCSDVFAGQVELCLEDGEFLNCMSAATTCHAQCAQCCTEIAQQNRGAPPSGSPQCANDFFTCFDAETSP